MDSRAAARNGRPSIITIPSSDRAFHELVLRIWAGSADAVDLESRLRRMFPLVLVRQRLLSGEPAWYVYRDGRWRPPEGPWWENDSLPRVVLSADGWVTDANATAAGLLGMEPGEIADHHFTDFVVPGTLDDALALFRVVEGGRGLDATIRLRPLSGSVVAVDLHAVSVPSGVEGVFRLAQDVETASDADVAPGPRAVATEPATDVAFRGYVVRALARMPEPTPDGLAMRVRRLYPRASVVADGDTWVVQREPGSDDDRSAAWWDDPALPCVRYDAEALILEANDAAAAMFGRDLVGHHWQEFVVAGTTDEVAVMLGILAEVGAAQSRFRMPRSDGEIIEFDSYTRVVDDDLITVMRRVDPAHA